MLRRALVSRPDLNDSRAVGEAVAQPSPPAALPFLQVLGTQLLATTHTLPKFLMACLHGTRAATRPVQRVRAAGVMCSDQRDVRRPLRAPPEHVDTAVRPRARPVDFPTISCSSAPMHAAVQAREEQSPPATTRLGRSARVVGIAWCRRSRGDCGGRHWRASRREGPRRACKQFPNLIILHPVLVVLRGPWGSGGASELTGCAAWSVWMDPARARAVRAAGGPVGPKSLRT
jgi:hypothetical protein